MDGIDVPAIAINLGPWALATTIILALVRGDLVPRRTHEKQMADRDTTILAIEKDRDYYRDQTLHLLGVAEVQAEAIADRQTRALLRRPNLPRSERGHS